MRTVPVAALRIIAVTTRHFCRLVTSMKAIDAEAVDLCRGAFAVPIGVCGFSFQELLFPECRFAATGLYV
jgi:hypothetical protein